MNERIQDLAQIDRLVHEPVRLMILMILQGVEEADFLYLMREGGFTQGNLSSHLAKLEEAGLTICRITAKGKQALSDYSETLVAALRPRRAR